MIIYASTSTRGGELISDTHEYDRGRFEVLAVPQLPDIAGLRTDVQTVRPTHELLSLLWVSDVPDTNMPEPHVPLGAYATSAQKADWLKREYPPHPVQAIPFAGYEPAKHRGGKQLGEGFEWVTVVSDGMLYLGLNDAEFASLPEALAPESVAVFGQAIRPVGPQGTMLREAYSLLGLFGVDESGQIQQ